MLLNILFKGGKPPSSLSLKWGVLAVLVMIKKRLLILGTGIVMASSMITGCGLFGGGGGGEEKTENHQVSNEASEKSEKIEIAGLTDAYKVGDKGIRFAVPDETTINGVYYIEALPNMISVNIDYNEDGVSGDMFTLSGDSESLDKINKAVQIEKLDEANELGETKAVRLATAITNYVHYGDISYIDNFIASNGMDIYYTESGESFTQTDQEVKEEEGAPARETKQVDTSNIEEVEFVPDGEENKESETEKPAETETTNNERG